MLFNDGENWNKYSTVKGLLSQNDIIHGHIIFFVNKKKIKDVGELHQRTVEEWEQLGQHVIDNAIRQETVSTQTVDSLNILCN